MFKWMWRAKHLPCAVTLLALALGGCDGTGRNPTGPAARARQQPVESTAAKTGRMPSDEECRQFASQMEQAIARGDMAAVNDLVDWQAVLESATGGISGIDERKAGFIRGALQGMRARGGLGGAIAQEVAKGGTYRFLRTVEVKGKKRARFRLLSPEGAVNYHDFILVRDASGRTRAVDIYVYISAELISKTMRRPFLALVASQPRSVLAKLTRSESDFVKHFDEYSELLQSVQQGRYRHALDIHGKLPESLKKDKNVLLIRLQAALKSGDDPAYAEAIRDFESFHPNDPCVAMISIDGHIMKQEYDKALACIDKLDRAIGGDPHLDSLRANICTARGDLATAKRFAEKAIRTDPTLANGYWSLVTISLAEKDFDETNRLFGEMEEKLQMQFSDLTRIADYAEYVKSPQYQEWLKTHPPASP